MEKATQNTLMPQPEICCSVYHDFLPSGDLPTIESSKQISNKKEKSVQLLPALFEPSPAPAIHLRIIYSHCLTVQSYLSKTALF